MLELVWHVLWLPPARTRRAQPRAANSLHQESLLLYHSNFLDTLALQWVKPWRRRIHEELKAVGDSPRLAGRAAQAAGTALQLLAERAEYMAASGPEVCARLGLAVGAKRSRI